MHFRYLLDPLFLFCQLTYWVNWGLEEFSLSPPLMQCYLNDVVCIPFWIPTIVFVARKLGWRNHDRRPDVIEIGIPLIMFAAVFEVILPSTAMFRSKAIADPYDVQCYMLGAVAANWLWSRMYDTDTALPSRSTLAEPE